MGGVKAIYGIIAVLFFSCSLNEVATDARDQNNSVSMDLVSVLDSSWRIVAVHKDTRLYEFQSSLYNYAKPNDTMRFLETWTQYSDSKISVRWFVYDSALFEWNQVDSLVWYADSVNY